MPDKGSERELRGYLDKLEGDGRTYRDLTGSAVYQLEPSWRTAILCTTCRYIGLVLSIPRRPMTWRCPRCAHQVRLTPPLEVLAAKDPQHSRLGFLRRRLN